MGELHDESRMSDPDGLPIGVESTASAVAAS